MPQDFLECNSVGVEEAAIFYSEKGLSIVKILPREKRPFEVAWQNMDYTSAEKVKQSFGNWNGNIGIRGDDSGLMGIDFDDARFRDAVLSLLPMLNDTLQSRGKKETGHYWVRLTKPLKNKSITLTFEDKTKQTFADLRGVGGQIVVAPSIHPDGMKYQWLNNNPILPIDTDVFLAVLDDACALVGAKNPYRKEEAGIKSFTYSGSNIYKAVKEAIPIESYVGSNDRVHCLVHKETTPNGSGAMRVYRGTNSVYCFSCGWCGDVIALHAKIRGISMFEAATDLATSYNVKIPILTSENEKNSWRHGANSNFSDSAKAPNSAKTKPYVKIYDVEQTDSAKAPNSAANSAISATPYIGVALWRLGRFLADKSVGQPEWVLPGVLPEKSIGMLAAKRSSLKTFLALYFGLSAAAGKENFMGKPEAVPVLYLDAENGEYIMQIRLNGLLSNFSETEKEKANKNFHLSIFQKIKLDDGAESLIDAIKASGAKLVIVDTLRRLSDGEENAAETSNHLLEGMQKAVQDTGCSILLLHHLRKSAQGQQKGDVDELDEIRGSSDITAAMSVIFTLKRAKMETDFILCQLKNRYGKERKPLALKIEGTAPEPMSIICSGELEEAVATENAAAYDMLLYLQQERLFEFSSKILTPLIVSRGHSHRSVDRAYQHLQGLGKIERVGRGQYRMVVSKTNEQTMRDTPALADFDEPKT